MLPSINFGSTYRGDFSFNIFSLKSLFNIEELEVKVVRSYSCKPVPVQIEALMIPKNYELTIVPSFDTYPLPPLLPDASGWVLKGEDVEGYTISLNWLPSTAIDIVVQAKVKNIVSRNVKIIRSKELHCIKNGYTIIDSDRSHKYDEASMGDEFSKNTYKCLISKQFIYIKHLNKTEKSAI